MPCILTTVLHARLSPGSLLLCLQLCFIHVSYLLVVLEKIVFLDVIVNSQQTEKDKLFRLWFFVRLFVCLIGTYNSWYKAAWLIQADWLTIVWMITGFMEIYFAVMCSGNIILGTDSLTVVHVCNNTCFFQTVCFIILYTLFILEVSQCFPVLQMSRERLDEPVFTCHFPFFSHGVKSVDNNTRHLNALKQNIPTLLPLWTPAS